MTIKFNEVTWYSKLLAAIVFLFCIPALFFYLGLRCGEIKGMSIELISRPVINDKQSIASSTNNVWKTYEVKGSQYRIDYPSYFRPTKESEGRITFANDDKTIYIIISPDAAGFSDDWKECALKDTTKILDSSIGINYLCAGSEYRIVADTKSGYYIVAIVSENEFNNIETRNMFKTMVSSFSVQ